MSVRRRELQPDAASLILLTLPVGLNPGWSSLWLKARPEHESQSLFEIMLDEVGCLAHLAFLLAPGRRRPSGARLVGWPRFSFG